MANTKDLIYRVQAEDEGAFTELMRVHYAFVYAVVIGFVNNPNDAEEIVQDTFLNAYRGLVQYEEREKFKNWLAEIARNSARDWLRKQRVNTVSIDEVSEHSVLTPDSPDEQLIRNEQRELIRRAIETLPQKDRDIARSYYLEGAGYDELIRTHGLSYKAISFRLSRAKQKLAKRLSHLLTGVFVSPASTLKQIYSGGLTVMKVGTVPKITAGAVAIIVLAFIGTRQFISSKEDSTPTVEIVASTPTEAETSAAQTDAARNGAVSTPLPEDKPQISSEEMEQIEDFFAQLDEADAQSDKTQHAEAEHQQGFDEHVSISTDAVVEDTEQSAEDVMNAYIEAFKNLDFEAMLPLLTGAAKEELKSLLPDMKNIMAEIDENGDDPVLKRMIELTLGRMLGGFEVVSSAYVNDEFHFRVRAPMPQIGALIEPLMPVIQDMPKELRAELPEINIPELPESVEKVVKMRNENGVWLVYED